MRLDRRNSCTMAVQKTKIYRPSRPSIQVGNDGEGFSNEPPRINDLALPKPCTFRITALRFFRRPESASEPPSQPPIPPRTALCYPLLARAPLSSSALVNWESCPPTTCRNSLLSRRTRSSRCPTIQGDSHSDIILVFANSTRGME
jgi:hypothetical protein